MSSKTLYLYKFWCVEEAKYYQAWSEKPPAVCPTNPEDTIDANKTEILDRVHGDSFEVRILEEEDGSTTGGHYGVCTFDFDDIPEASGWHKKDFSFPYPISLLSAEWTNVAANEGDEIRILIDPDKALGAITADVAAEVDVIPLSAASIAILKIGYGLVLNDGENEEDLGQIYSIDDVANTVKTSKKTVASFTAATPTNAFAYIPMVVQGKLHGIGLVQIGGTKIGGTFIKANTKIRIWYNNVGGIAGRKFIPWMEFIY